MANVSQVEAVKEARKQRNRSRTVVEPAREGKYSDRIKYDPFELKTWHRLHEAGQMQKRA